MKAYQAALTILETLPRNPPESPEFATVLGTTLNNVGMIDLDERRYEEARVRFRQAVEWHRKFFAIEPKNPTARQSVDLSLVNLIKAARALGDSSGAAEAQRELAKLRDSDPATAALDARLAAIIKGDQQPKDNAERLRLAQRAYDKALYATSARLWSEALAADPKLADDRVAQHRYNAACCAALAVAGKGEDDPRPDEAARANLRAQALGWLKSELAAWSKALDSGDPKARAAVAATLRDWKQDPDLAGVRQADAVVKLPEAERAGWDALWSEVERLLGRASSDQ
jgi:tetratricopeptide (TPR) repeat protein